jgi:alpha-L-arabinofuranosidase
MEIGNENSGPTYQAHYRRFYDAIKARYPQMHLVADTLTKERPTEINDEHYYNSPEFFLRNADKYDRYDRSKWKVYVGEYAVTEGAGLGNLRAAIGEAAFMTGMERNSDVVLMSSYAPLFVFPAWKHWNPNAIVFDATQTYGTPSYHVQAMFAQNRADVNLPVQVTSPMFVDRTVRGGMIGVGTWATQAEFKDIRVSQGEKVLFQSDFSKGLKGWNTRRGGTWDIHDGALRQLGDQQPATALISNPRWTDYTLTLKARKLSGHEGFLISVRAPNDHAKSWWNLGGWGNRQHGLEMAGVDNVRLPGRIETGRWYDICIELKGSAIRCYLDGKLIQEAAPGRLNALYAVAGRMRTTGEIVLKVVNAADVPQQTQIELQGMAGLAPSARALVLTSGSGEDENTFAEPTKVAPRATTIEHVAPTFRHVFPAHSVTVLRFPPR